MKKQNRLLLIVNILWGSAFILAVPIFGLIVSVATSLYPSSDGIDSAANNNFSHPLVAAHFFYLAVLSILTITLNIKAIVKKKVTSKKYIGLLIAVIVLALPLGAWSILGLIFWLPEFFAYLSA